MQENHKILVVDDDMRLRALLERYLTEQGFQVRSVANAEQMDRLLTRESFHLMVLDLMLPGEDGLSICRRLRSQSNPMPIIMVTAKGEEVDRIVGLEIGADDYITKPFNPRELTIRARNLLSRTMNLGSLGEERRLVESYKFNGWELDINSRSLISPAGEQYKLPRSEFRAMLHFCENPGKIQSRGELLKKMTGRELKPHDRTVDVTIRRIRKHFESTPDTPEIIATIHGEGYRFCGDLEE
ncbi:two-component system response regulator ArcA [Serratia marcescens]|nr:two-component system response regulator ArcA [Serratia marcescens]RTF89427.1 two-component system response regulator ArcA [Serratia marcescens]RTG08190.1 two-component system response regulator ArcA [Serratia marcescens]